MHLYQKFVPKGLLLQNYYDRHYLIRQHAHDIQISHSLHTTSVTNPLDLRNSVSPDTTSRHILVPHHEGVHPQERTLGPIGHRFPLDPRLVLSH